MRSMSTVRITVSLPEELVTRARRAVKVGQASSVSAYVAEALRRQRTTDEEFRADIDEALEMTGGPPTPEERAWARSVLGY
jgi:Arc/MetJ-type ribon-helix-helix transcriptional regulator